MNSSETHHVAILLATYNGQYYLTEQLNSFLNQNHSNWSILVSDDGSTDKTLDMLNQFRLDNGFEKMTIVEGPHKGFAANFFSLVCSEKLISDYYAFSDQDDVWENNKLERAVTWLKTIPRDVPALYCARTRLVDQCNCDIGFSPLFKKALCFSNALVQSVAGGNTMVFNDAARNILKQSCTDIHVLSHDWWSYIVLTGCGAKILYDFHPSLRYRQHGANLTGMNTSWTAKLSRIRQLFQGRYKKWNDENMIALAKSRALLTPDNQKIFDQFVAARKSNFFARLYGLYKIKVHRQTVISNLGFIAAAIFNRV